MTITPPLAPVFALAAPVPSQQQRCANAWLRRHITVPRRSTAIDKAISSQAGCDDLFECGKSPFFLPLSPEHPCTAATQCSKTICCRYFPAIVHSWNSGNPFSNDSDATESIIAWLPTESGDEDVGGTRALAANEVLATHADLLPANPVSAHAIEDMSNLLFTGQQHMLHNLKQRFDWRLIHTFVGSILVICNPYAIVHHMCAVFF
jgi:hypothetical protein